jgi:hypothetical protein
MEAAQNYLHMRAKKVIAKNIHRQGSGQVAWFLERREKDRYSKRVEQKHEGEVAMTYADLADETKAKTPQEAVHLKKLVIFLLAQKFF